MQYKVELLEFDYLQGGLEKYLNKKRIRPEQIVSISYACDNGTSIIVEGMGLMRSVNKILLVYVED